jgi:hypothetical protein
MTATISRLFDNYSTALQAVRDLETAGVPHSEISIVASNADGWYAADQGTSARRVSTPDRVDRNASSTASPPGTVAITDATVFPLGPRSSTRRTPRTATKGSSSWSSRPWITSSALGRSVSGTVRPSAVAVLTFTAISNLAGT